MEGNFVTVSGDITTIYRPKSWNFNDIEYTSFMLKTKEEHYLCVGNSFELFEGEAVVLTGVVEVNSKGKKFSFNSIKVDLNGVPSLKKYLAFICGKKRLMSLESAMLPSAQGITATDKKRFIYERVFSWLNQGDVQSLTQFDGIGKILANSMITKFQKNKELENLYVTLAPFGLTLSDCVRIKKNENMRGKDIVDILQKNPFKLMNLVDFSFNKCDIIYSKNGGTYNSSCRLLAAVIFSLNDELNNGNTFSPIEMILKKCNSYLAALNLYGNREIDAMELSNAIDCLVKHQKIVNDNGMLYLKYVWEMEEYLRSFIKKILIETPSKIDYSKFISEYESMLSAISKCNFKFGAEQIQSIQNSLNNRVSIITGGPGTGKTSSIACIVKGLLELKQISEADIALCAPTGKAARRMMESINEQLGTAFKATTIHSLLQVDPSDDTLERFIFNENHKLPAKAVIIDEMSMTDMLMIYSLLIALKDDTIIIFVGDIEQLPPVSYGYFLRDAIASKIPCVKLLEVHRQAGESSIIGLSKAIRDESLDKKDLAKKADFAFIEQPKDEDYNKKMSFVVDLFDRARKRDGLDNVVVLTPLKGNNFEQKMSAQRISLAIQEKILPYDKSRDEFCRNGWIFRVGSKVIITKNDNQKNLVNGEIGYIKEINPTSKKVVVKFPDKDEPVTLDDENIDSLKLAYALTVHKSQGSEWQDVIYCCYSETAMNKKSLVYTAITRAKKNLIVVGNQDAFLKCIKNKGETRRTRILN